MNIKLLSPLAKAPTKDPGNAGYDLYSTEDYTLWPGERKLFKTDIAISIPEGQYGQILGRSGLAYKHGILVLGGVIDQIYRGNIGVILVNTSSGQQARTLEVKTHDRIAQIVFLNYNEHDFDIVDDLDETTRQDGAYGSSGR